MKTAKDIERQIRELRHRAGAGTHHRILSKLVAALEERQRRGSVAMAPVQRRTIMRHPATKLGAAAAIVVACVTCLFLWKGTGSGVTLADVLDKLEQIATYSYQTRSILTRPQGREERLATVLASRDHGIRIDARSIDPNTGETRISETDYVLPEQDCILFLSHESKTYIRLKFDDPAELEQHEGENNDPRAIVRQLLEHDHVCVGQSVIDGTVVEGFKTTDPNYEDSFPKISDWMGKNEEVDVTLWVDVKTRLPIRLVEDIVKRSGMRFHEVTDDFHWNVVVTADDFTPAIPEGYTSPMPDLVVPVFNEETAIRGLRTFADIAGTYPVNLMGMKPLKEYQLLADNDGSAWEDLSEDEKSRRMNDIEGPILGLGMFYEELSEKKKDPAYYGATVGPGDADKVLLRWKLDDGQYRVILGNLGIKNVAPEELADLEKP